MNDVSLFQMAVAAKCCAEYLELIRGYYPLINERIIRREYAALPEVVRSYAAVTP